MSTFEEQIAIYHNWSIEYCNKVIFEYERFLHLRINNQNIIASDDIYKLWKYHILTTENYTTYCLTKFGIVISHNPFNEINKETKYNRLIQTLEEYQKNFGCIVYQDVWICNVDLSINLVSQFVSLMASTASTSTSIPAPALSFPYNGSTSCGIVKSMTQTNFPIHIPTQNSIFNKTNIEYPSYLTNKPLSTELKIYITYNKQIITYVPQQTDNIDKLKDLLSLNLNIKKDNINLYLHPDIIVNVFDKRRIIANNNMLNYENKLTDLMTKSYNFIICEII